MDYMLLRLMGTLGDEYVLRDCIYIYFVGVSWPVMRALLPLNPTPSP
jgi:hypothetical protein